jgi:hypothetical protein
MTWKPVAGIAALKKQIDERWAKRDHASDGIKGDSAHASRISDHNEDSQGYVHALDVDEDLKGSKYDNVWLSDQIIANARLRRSGSVRLKNVVYENRVASGTYPNHFWTWRNDPSLGHEHHMHISFSTHGQEDGMDFTVPILTDGVGKVWDGVVPFYDVLENAISSGTANKATWRLACRMKELGFYDGTVQPEGKQAYPKNAIRSMQDYMGWDRREYDQKVHKSIWKEITVSDTKL